MPVEEILTLKGSNNTRNEIHQTVWKYNSLPSSLTRDIAVGDQTCEIHPHKCHPQLCI